MATELKLANDEVCAVIFPEVVDDRAATIFGLLVIVLESTKIRGYKELFVGSIVLLPPLRFFSSSPSMLLEQKTKI